MTTKNKQMSKFDLYNFLKTYWRITPKNKITTRRDKIKSAFFISFYYEMNTFHIFCTLVLPDNPNEKIKERIFILNTINNQLLLHHELSDSGCIITLSELRNKLIDKTFAERKQTCTQWMKNTLKDLKKNPNKYLLLIKHFHAPENKSILSL